jgi:tetratricopeptide (TPR) repeat protein
MLHRSDSGHRTISGANHSRGFVRRPIGLLTKPTAINPGYAFAYYVKSLVLFSTKQLPEAIEAGRTTVSLDPNAAYGYFALGHAEGALGRCQQSG